MYIQNIYQGRENTAVVFDLWWWQIRSNSDDQTRNAAAQEIVVLHRPRPQQLKIQIMYFSINFQLKVLAKIVQEMDQIYHDSMLNTENFL